MPIVFHRPGTASGLPQLSTCISFTHSARKDLIFLRPEPEQGNEDALVQDRAFMGGWELVWTKPAMGHGPPCLHRKLGQPKSLRLLACEQESPHCTRMATTLCTSNVTSPEATPCPQCDSLRILYP